VSLITKALVDVVAEARAQVPMRGEASDEGGGATYSSEAESDDDDKRKRRKGGGGARRKRRPKPEAISARLKTAEGGAEPGPAAAGTGAAVAAPA
jgi:hypothetical protein